MVNAFAKRALESEPEPGLAEKQGQNAITFADVNAFQPAVLKGDQQNSVQLAAFAGEIPKTKTVYVDIGHCTSGERNPLGVGVGGRDQGFVGPGYSECDINKAVGKELVKELKNMGLYVVPTWDVNNPPPPAPKSQDLERRIDTVNRDVAKYGDDAVYVSIHHDSDTTKQGGQCVFFAATKREESQVLARSIQATAWQVREREGVRDCINPDTASGKGYLDGLRRTNAIGVLIEGANVLNPRDRALMPQSRFQQIEAKGIAQGIFNYFNLRPGVERPYSSAIRQRFGL